VADMTATREIDVIVDHHLVGLVDRRAPGERPAVPHASGRFVSVSPGYLLIESDDDVLDARLRIEAWTGEPPFDEASWPLSDAVLIDLPSGLLGVDEIAAGGKSDVFEVPFAGRCRVRVAWRPGTIGESPEAWGLVQFWPAGGD
jgi:hypothetical protein